MICRVPATSANMGPGFDALGVALTLSAEIGVIDTSLGFEVPDGAHPADEHHIATVAFRRLGGDGRLWERSPIPMGRGLGYSAAVRLAGLLLACAQRGSRDPVAEFGDEALEHAVELEGHADNAAAALLGGVVATTGARSVQVPLRLDPAVVVWVPSFTTRTDQSRSKLGPSVPLADAVFNIGRTALLVAALAVGDVEALRDATDDRIHQSARFAASPACRNAHDAALAAGAWCAWLSGSGPTVAAMCPVDAAPALAAAMPTHGHTKVLRIDHVGAVLET